MSVEDQRIGAASQRVTSSTLTDEELEKLAIKIAKDWKKLGRRLAVTDAKLEDIDGVYEQLSEKGYQMLKQWKQSQGTGATCQALCEALQHDLVQRQDLADNFYIIIEREVVETGINSARVYCCQTTPGKLRQVEAEQHQQRETLKKLQEEIKDLRKLLEKVVENSTESSVKETEHIRSVFDQLDEDVEKVSEELKKLTDYNNKTELNETAGCEQGTGFNLPRREEFTMAVNTLSSSERHGKATLPVDLKQSKSEGKEVKETELNGAQFHSTRLWQVVSSMTVIKQKLETLEEIVKSLQELLKQQDGNKAMETRVQEIETSLQQLKASFENSVKDLEVEEMELLGKDHDQMGDCEKIPEEYKNVIEKSSDCNNFTVLDETACCEEGMCLTSPQEEVVNLADRIPNTLRYDVSPDLQGNVSFLHKATSPVKLTQSKPEGNKTCFGCLELDKKLVRVNELERENKILRGENGEIKSQLKTLKKRLKSPDDVEEKRVKAVSGKQRPKSEGDLRQQIKDLEKKNKELVTDNCLLSKVNEDGTSECENLRTERDQLSAENKRLRDEIYESQLKGRTLEEEINKWRNAVSRVFQPSEKRFSSSAGVISALKKDASAKLVATRSSDGSGEPSDIFDHKKVKESGTEAKQNSWWCVDLGEKNRLFITHCALRHGKEDFEATLQHWQLQGSMDGRTWTNLMTSHDPTFHTPFLAPRPYPTGRWTVQGEVGAFRYFRIWQTGKHSSGKYGIYLSGVELYGVLVKM